MRETNINAANRKAWQNNLVNYAPYILIGVILLILPSFLSIYFRSAVTEIFIYAIFAMSLNILFGYTGLFSIAHAAFFGTGAYTVGILILRLGIHSFWVAAPAGILMGAFAAALVGIPALRVKGIYFMLVTIAFAQLFANIAWVWRVVTGGSNGLVGIPYPDFGIPGLTMTGTSFYYFVFIVFVICMYLVYRLINSPFGQALQGIRDDEGRMAHLGYNIWLYKYLAFIIAGAFAGVGGVLFAHFSGVLVPDHLGAMASTMGVLMVIIGSSDVVFGPAIGAAVVLLLQRISSLYFPERWPLLLGGVFVISVVFLRGGITIYLVNLWKGVRHRYGSAKD